MTNPIYKPAGRALEYSPDALALNIYTGCPHRCYYCFAPGILHKTREQFHSHVEPHKGILEAVKRQLDKGEIRDKLIHLCFTCDPYPVGCDTTITREIIKAIKDSGNHVQILTKGSLYAQRDFDLLDTGDWFGVTISCYDIMASNVEPGAAQGCARRLMLSEAKNEGINTWVSCEPVIDPEAIYRLISEHDYIDLYRIGKLNYHPSSINWGDFGHECERLCREYERNYYIKHDLRKAMTLKTCGTCRWHYQSADMFGGDFACVNPDSENCTEWTDKGDSCEKWEGKNEDYSYA